MNDIERGIKTAAPIAPRVTLADIEANIYYEYYFTAADGVLGAYKNNAVRVEVIKPDHEVPCSSEALRHLTFCVLVLRNGFTVTGESACVSPENFDVEIGRKIARQKAVENIWPLMGYALKVELSKPWNKND